MLNLTPDELLTTTRAVRRRLDLGRSVEKEVIKECLSIALQAPNGGNRQSWQFLVVTDPRIRSELGKVFRKGADEYFAWTKSAIERRGKDFKLNPSQERTMASARYLVDHIEQVPVYVIPCMHGRPNEEMPTAAISSRWGSIIPAIWSFMLAARARGLGTSFTTFHLYFEEEAAKILNVPYSEITQVCLIPVAYSKGVDFNPGPRKPVDSVIHWETW